MKSNIFNANFAFTLAEVLVTLGIIGVVASMTLPSVINSYKEKETVAKLKKTYSILSQAYLTSFNEHEFPTTWTWTPQSYPIPQDILGYLSESLNVVRKCDDGKCFPNVVYRRLNGTNHTNYHNWGNNMASVILQDGTLISLWSNGRCEENTKNCGFIYTDINGVKGPNQFGRDMFGFTITPKNLMPFGVEGREYPFSTSCKRKQNVYLNGLGCTAWVIQNENMDYLHCDNLSWGSKISCK